ncbi:MAG: mechanosensitive ion channel family protein [Allosphingosinicella sp.]
MQNAAEIAAEPFELIGAKADAFVEGFFYQLPNILLGLVLLVLAWLAARLLASGIRRIGARRGRPDLGVVLGSLAKAALYVLAVLFAAAIIFPSVKPADILATLGIGSVAIGFAFKDILQNLLAGLLLLIRRPFRQGDQIVVKDFEGTVEHIESRATLIKTYDGRRVIIPNADIYTSPVVVNTAYDLLRGEYDVGIGYGDDPARAAAAFREAIAGVEGVLADPAPEAFPWALNDSTVDLRLWWWTASSRANMVHVRARVIRAVYEKAKALGIDLPFPTQVMLFHDQTEATDGDRSRQREGWPAGEDPPRPRRVTVVKEEGAR